jgi:Protein of unknown function (DUF1553)/Protein of unknown function (DUF1549)/Concanavalin A-like lectin/glucanases superfamily/Planctomycete cytochrome C
MPVTCTRSLRVRAVLLVCIVLTAAVCALTAACRSHPPAVAGVPDVVDFNFHVKPILSDRCFKCHGPDDRARKAGLRLDLKDGAFGELRSGRRAIVPGRTHRSELVRRITSADPKVLMPLPESHLTLNEYEKAVLIRWIEQGAEWKPHWSFIRPPEPALPPVRTHGWTRNEIDRFVLAAMEPKGLRPAPEASRETLIRRVTFDLTGLPPTIDEIDAFLSDQSPDAYERVVDRLLASPRYGERVATEWLDLARYADSHGYQDDGMRTMWPWRDWVISAFNRNLPFDQFVTWQLAGDLLPSPSDEQLLATGFNRNHMQSQEGGIVSEEYRTEYVVDRVNTLGRALLGISVECARCHDHKYDPITQKDYYRLFSFFNNVNETGQVPYSGVASPTLMVRDVSTETTLAAIRQRMRALEGETRADNPAFDDGFAAWLASGAASSRVTISSLPGLIAYLPLDKAEHTLEYTKVDPKTREKPKLEPVVTFANVATPRQRGTLGGDKDRIPTSVAGKVGNALTLVGDSYISVGEKFAFFERHQPFSFALWFRIDQRGAAGPLVTRSGGIFNGNRGYEVLLRADGTFAAGLHHVAPDNSMEIETQRPASVGTWHHLALTYDGSSRAGGIRLFLDGQAADSRVTIDNLQSSIIYAQNKGSWGDPPPLRLGRRHDETLQDVSVDEFRVYDRQLTSFEVAVLGGAPDPIGQVLAIPAADRSAAQGTALREHYLLRVDPAFAQAFGALTTARGKENDLLTSLTEVMIVRELPTPRPAFVLARGAYDAPTEAVTPGPPQALGDLPAGSPPNRLGLARWLLDPSHPLTARVVVNRYWALLFGQGIVSTPADFGSQGRLPTHPELLDWLATSFVKSGWDLKALQKRIVTSATYRQSSVTDPTLVALDPANEWLARGPSYRLSAEQIRDAALAASALLVGTIGGPSVYPYQPPGLWEALATRNATTYTQGRGDALHRRSLYTVWKRSSPPPSAISFDAAERLFCTVNRQRTNTPLQALVLLNDPQYVEASRAIAERVMKQGGVTPRDRIAFAFRLITSRPPRPEELALLETLYREEHAGFAQDPRRAIKLLSVGEHRRDPAFAAAESAAYAVVASTLLNFDEAVIKR